MTSSDPIVRKGVADELYRLVDATRNSVERLAKIAQPLLVLLRDAELAVVSSAARSFDFLCSKPFYKQDYELALVMADALASRGINLDLQSARRWECLAALGRDEEAESAWHSVELTSRPHDRAPRQHHGLHTDYPSFETWRAFAELRIATALLWASQGKHPSQELRKKIAMCPAPSGARSS